MFGNTVLLAAGYIDIDGSLAIQMIMFLLLFLVLRPLILDPYLKAVEARRDGLQGSREEADEMESRADRSLADYEKKMRDARREAQEVREGMKTQGQDEFEDLIAEARQEIADRLASERGVIQTETQEGLKQLATRSDSLAKSIVARVLPALLLVMLFPADAFAAAPGGEFPWVSWAVSIVNLAIYIGIIVYFAGPKVQEYFSDRRENLLADLNAAKNLRIEAEQRLEEVTNRLEKLEDERKALMDEYHEQGMREKDRLVAEAQRQVEKMRSDAELVLQQELRKAVHAIEQQAIDLAMGLAEKQVQEKVDDQVQGALVDQYLNDMKSLNKKAA